MHKSLGFSMIELMVVLVIIGILGSFAVPAYQEHLVKARAMELFALAQPAKLAVTDALIAGKQLKTMTHETLGLENMDNNGSLQSLTIAAGVIQVTGDGERLGLSAKENPVFQLTPTKAGAVIQWECTTTANFKKYLPSLCRAV
jgi:type IV pilus assembly protein PilA